MEMYNVINSRTQNTHTIQQDRFSHNPLNECDNNNNTFYFMEWILVYIVEMSLVSGNIFQIYPFFKWLLHSKRGSHNSRNPLPIILVIVKKISHDEHIKVTDINSWLSGHSLSLIIDNNS